MPELVELPRIPVAPEEVPAPYHKLLVHPRDMTSTLAEHHGTEIHLDVLAMREEDGEITRTVLLLADGKPVEYGWITIQLDVFSDTARDSIREGRLPLGAIMEQDGTAYRCDPHTYFRVEPDAALRELLATGHSPLYGRVNRITTTDGTIIADVVEILP